MCDSQGCGRKVPHVQKLGEGEGDGCVVGLGKRLGDFGPKVLAPRAGTLQKDNEDVLLKNDD